MKNNFKENLNRKIINDVRQDTILGLQQQLRKEAKFDVGDIYDAFKTLEQTKGQLRPKPTRQAQITPDSIDYGLALNIFLQKFLLENQKEVENIRTYNIETQRNELGIQETKNPKFFIDINNYYYSFDYDKFIREEHIINVALDGCYTTKESIYGTNYYAIKVFTIEDSIKNIKVVNEHNRQITDFKEVVKVLKLKKEIVKKVKRIGYCGNSFDTCADLLNLFYKPIETGYYSDNKYNFYYWDPRNSQFVQQVRKGLTPGAPNISDYELFDSKTIIRTDYNGAGLEIGFNLQLA